MRRGLLLMVCGAMLAAACSGDDSGSGSATTVAPASSTAATSVPTTTSTTRAPSTTTTTEAPPQPVPAGVRWDEPVEVTPTVARQIYQVDLVRINDELWLMGTVYNGSWVVRSADGGATWDPVEIEPAPTEGAYDVEGIIGTPDGGYLAYGSMGYRCDTSLEAPDPDYRTVGLCRRFSPVVHLSEDGIDWRRIDPPALAPPGDSTVKLANVITTAEGFLAAGTVRGPDWHARVWSSPDGEVWTLEREIRFDWPTSGVSILADGESVVLLAEEHPCAVPAIGTPGWVLGTAWPKYGRILEGPSVASLELTAPGDHPLAVAPEQFDCEETDAFWLSVEPHQRFVGELLDGRITVRVIDWIDPPEDEEGFDAATAGARSWAQLVDGEWEVTRFDGVPVVDAPLHRERFQTDLFSLAGTPTLLEYRTAETTLLEPLLYLPDESGFELREPDRPIFASEVFDAVWTGEALVLAGLLREDPYDPTSPAGIYVWRSVEGLGPKVDTCTLEPGADCRFADLTVLDGYPDFAGRDLTGIDLRFAEAGEASFGGAVFSDGLLWSFQARDSSFGGAVFDGAHLQDARLGDATGASFVGAALFRAAIDDVTNADFTDADLTRARVSLRTQPDLSSAVTTGVSLEMIWDETGAIPYELNLAGLDLTRVRVRGTYDAEQNGVLLVVTDLTGSLLDSTNFDGVDLSLIDADSVDLTEMEVWEGSICPDGLPPDDPPIGTCDRAPESGG